MNKYWLPYYAPADANVGGTVAPFGESGDVAILEEGADGPDDKVDADEDDEAAEGEEDKEDTGEEEDKEGDKDKDEEDDSERGEDEDKEEPQVGRPGIKAISEKYPKLFKEFPELKNAYFKVNAFEEVFPSVDDAREAAGKAEILDNFEENMVRRGSATELFKSISDVSPKAIERFVENLLPNLFDYNANLFYKATEPVTKQLLWSAKQHGVKTGNKNLVASTQHIADYLFGDAEVEQPKDRKSKETDPERIEFEREKANYEGQRRNDFMGELNARAGKSLEKAIKDGLDPKNVMTDFLRTTVSEKIMDEIGARLEKDERHMSRMKSLHNRAAKAGYPKAMTDQITAAYLSAAKLLIPVVRTEIKQKALHGRSEKKVEGRRQIPSGGESSNSGRSLTKLSPKQVDWGKTSDLDFINDKVVLKKH